MFRTADGYLAWIDGIGTVEGRTLAETRREARTFLRTVLGGAFPDRPEVDLEGTAAVLRYSVDVRLRRGRPRAPGAARSAPRAAAPGRQNGRRP